MAKKAIKKIIFKQHHKGRAFKFTCLRCKKFSVVLRASSMTEVESMALIKHDDHHTANGSFCPADLFEIGEE